MQKTNIPQAESKSADLVAQNLEQLKQIFPEVIKEGRVDFEVLNDLLGNYGDTAEERFCLNWAGKANARREAQKRSTGTLRPCPEESVDWDTTENLYIEGDNLEVLKLMQKSYHSRVKMIYIDPPYNTGKDFVYKDNYADNMKNYLELTGQDKKLSTNTESDGRYHSNWLNMMYPRLKLARNLLTDDGVIFISIDDNEVANLRKVCDEIFGEENFLNHFAWVSNITGRQISGQGAAKTWESILVYAKNINNSESLNVSIQFAKNNMPDSYKGFNRDIRKDSRGEYAIGDTLYNHNRKFNEETRKNLVFSIFFNPVTEEIETGEIGEIKQGFIEIMPHKNGDGRHKYHAWRWSRQKIKNESYDLIVLPTNTNGYEIYTRIRDFSQTLLKDVITNIPNGDSEVQKIFDDRKYFEYPKSTSLIRLMLGSIQEKDSIILDFFSGSATTAHAVMQLNAEDGGNRKYICVQLPEATPEESEARKAGYATIPEIAKERIRRAGKKIVEEQKTKAENQGGLFTEEEKKLDIGFKVFKLDSSNINAWDSNPDNLEASLHNSLFNIKEDRSEDDLLYEILIKYGIELTEKINSHIIDGKTVYEMGAGSLMVCLADNLSTTVAEGIGKLYKEVSPEGIDGNCRVVFKEAGFDGSDEVKTNTLLILKQHGITNVATV